MPDKTFRIQLEKQASWCELCPTREQAGTDGTPGTLTLWYGLIHADGMWRRSGLSLCPAHRIAFAEALVGPVTEEPI
mgnify:FL=1